MNENIISLKRKNVKNIIKEAINTYLFEYHHSGNNDLYNDTINIGKKIVEYFKKGWDGKTPYIYKSLSFDETNYKTIYVYLTDSDVSQYEVWSTIKISKSLVEDAINSNSYQRLLSAIYHELGHMVNLVKSNSLYQAKKDINSPLLLKMNNDKYKEISKILYRFNLRELKARCFETEMFLKQSGNKNITIKEVYDNRCSDITLMRNFLTYLYNCSKDNLSENDKYIIDELYQSIFNKTIINKSGLNDNDKAKKLYNFFGLRLKWFKVRIDKIYNDYIKGE